MMRSPSASSLAERLSPSPNSAMRPPASAIQPRSMIRSASAICAFAITVSGLVEVIAVITGCLSSGRGCEARHVDDPVSDQATHLVIMDDCDHGDAGALLFVDEMDHDIPVGGVERRCRLVQQQHGQLGN